MPRAVPALIKGARCGEDTAPGTALLCGLLQTGTTRLRAQCYYYYASSSHPPIAHSKPRPRPKLDAMLDAIR